MPKPETRPLSLVVVRPTLGLGGADRVTITLLQFLDRAKVTPSLVLIRREGPYLEDVPEDVPLHELKAASLWTAWWPLTRYLKSTSTDILLSTCSGTNVAACIAHILSGRRGRLILSERNVLLRDQPFAKKWLMLLAKQLLYPTANAITAVSRGVANDLIDRLFLDPDRIRVVYNPIVGPELERLAAKDLEEPPYDDDAPVILAAGRLVPAKGFDVLLRAFAKLDPEHEARLVILGEGPLRGNLLSQAADLGICERLFLPGFVKNPLRHMSRATIFVLSSRYEGLPGVLIQAMACGLPVISTDCPAGPDEIITPGRDGLLVSVDSAEEIADELSGLLRDEDLRTRLGNAARERARSFATEPVVNDYLRVLIGEPTEPADER
ncbi:MAG: glycosyltransferase [bacterium]|nr:glycosyltransferase [bacterium]